MSRFDRYLLSQFTILFGFFSLILVSVYWVNRAIGLFDQLLADGQTALVFLEFTLLTLPNVILVVLPISAFVAVLNVVNRLSAESELIVAQTAGMSSWRIARPALYFGLLVAVLVAILAHVLVPASRTQLGARATEIARDVTARFLKEGEFLHPGSGITVYIRSITLEGELQDIFLQDRRDPATTVTYTASRALLVETVAGPRLVMFDGMAQTLEADDQRLSVVTFDDFTYLISEIIGDSGSRHRDLRELTTAELLSPTEELLSQSGSTPAQFLFEAHDRFASPLLALFVPVIGLGCLLLGGFSRFGLWRQIIGAVVIIILVQMSANIAEDAARRDANLWFLAYLPALIAALAAVAVLWRANRRAIFPARRVAA